MQDAESLQTGGGSDCDTCSNEVSDTTLDSDIRSSTTVLPNPPADQQTDRESRNERVEAPNTTSQGTNFRDLDGWRKWPGRLFFLTHILCATVCLSDEDLVVTVLAVCLKRCAKQGIEWDKSQNRLEKCDRHDDANEYKLAGRTGHLDVPFQDRGRGIGDGTTYHDLFLCANRDFRECRAVVLRPLAWETSRLSPRIGPATLLRDPPGCCDAKYEPQNSLLRTAIPLD